MPVRGVRGAIVANHNTPYEIAQATQDLLNEILLRNPDMQTQDLAGAFFTTSEELNADFPARAARELGWQTVPMMCAKEIDVPGALSNCIRVLLLWNTDLPQPAIKHVYLGEAASLRPDLVD